MKKIFLIPLLAIAIGCSSQIPVANGYIANNKIDKFEGTWIWTSGTDTLVIRLKKVIYKFIKPENSYSEDLMGCHTYIKNGVVVENSMNKYDSLDLHNKQNLSTVFLWNTINYDTSVVQGTIRDISKSKNVKIKLVYLPGFPTRISAIVYEDRTIRYTYPGNPRPYIPGITLPTSEIILTKQ